MVNSFKPISYYEKKKFVNTYSQDAPQQHPYQITTLPPWATQTSQLRELQTEQLYFEPLAPSFAKVYILAYYWEEGSKFAWD